MFVDDVQWVGLGMTLRGAGVSRGLLWPPVCLSRSTSFKTAGEMNESK